MKIFSRHIIAIAALFCFFAVSLQAKVEPEQTLYAKAEHRSMRFQGLEREYYVYVPDSLAPQRPLVLMLHGYGGKAYGYRPEMLESARLHGFAVCIPQGYGVDGKFKPGWNVGYPVQKEMGTDDVAFVLKLTDRVCKEFGLSRANAFYSGMSNGGDLAYMIAFSHPDAFNAIASVAGLEMQWVSRTMSPKGHVPFMEVHGTADKTSKWAGDPENEGGWGEYLAVPVAVGDMISANRCEYEKQEVLPLKDEEKRSRKVTLHRYLGSPYGAEVRLYEVKGGKHSWHMADMDTTEEIWKFFAEYLK